MANFLVVLGVLGSYALLAKGALAERTWVRWGSLAGIAGLGPLFEAVGLVVYATGVDRRLDLSVAGVVRAGIFVALVGIALFVTVKWSRQKVALDTPATPQYLDRQLNEAIAGMSVALSGISILMLEDGGASLLVGWALFGGGAVGAAARLAITPKAPSIPDVARALAWAGLAAAGIALALAGLGWPGFVFVFLALCGVLTALRVEIETRCAARRRRR